AIFVPSGTFGNQLSLFTHCERGNEVILDDSCHIVQHEAGASSIIAGVQLRTIKCESGYMEPDEIESKVRQVKDQHFPVTGLICMENAHSSGRVVTPEHMEKIYNVANKFGIPVHLDGARLFNAAISLEKNVREITKNCDSVMFCLSKGLGAPVGSILAGSAAFIQRAAYKRKIMGGGMRQVGVLAAPGLVALTRMVDRLSIDHENARTLADMIKDIPGITVKSNNLDINMIFFETDRDIEDASFVEYFKGRNILVYPPEDGVFRFVTNYGIDTGDLPLIARTLEQFMNTQA
ncbi:MAG: aminotransferase class I/II-fold pyridoxal phosphate-dependent enzyme, partial [Clostridia bacterium]|nr:aminotransferase class I/II-fold pyridoxal phosphate-dependent enzyme [Clostridia bacterium]